MKISLNYDGLLLCPVCGGEYLHHEKITVYDLTEDTKTTKEITVSGEEISTQTVTSSISGNPSARRHGLRIWFWCEYCDAVHALTIAQHKGSTKIDWETGTAAGGE